MMELFQVHTVMKEYDGYKDVPFIWFCPKRVAGPRPYADLIEGYQPTSEFAGYSESCIDEFFNRDEANMLKEFLDRICEPGDVTTIEAIKLPIPSNWMGFGSLAVGGNNDFYMLDRTQNYSLPFAVWGYFDFRQASGPTIAAAHDAPEADMLDDHARRGAHDDETD
jgi:hypothetical protein